MHRSHIDTHQDVLGRLFRHAGLVHPTAIPIRHIPASDLLFRVPAAPDFALGPGHRVSASPVIVPAHLVTDGTTNGCTGHCGDNPAITMAKLVTHQPPDNRTHHRGGSG